MPRPPVLLAALLGPVLAGAALGGCTRQPAEGLPPGVTVEDLPQSESWDVRLRTSEEGRPRVEVEAPYLARFDRDSASVYLGPSDGDSSAVTLRLYSEAGERGSVRAAEVWMDDRDGLVTATGRVRAAVAGPDGAVVQAARVVLDGDDVTAAGDVTADVLSGGGARVRAPRLALGAGGAFRASGGAVVDLSEAGATVRAATVRGSGSEYVAEGSVRVTTRGGRTLEAARVVWDRGADRFRAPGAFSFDGPGERVRGVGLTATADLSRYSFRKATGEIEVRE